MHVAVSAEATCWYCVVRDGHGQDYRDALAMRWRCGACSIASLTKFRRAKQTGFDICCCQCLFLRRSVRLFPSALTICSKVMNVLCCAISSQSRTPTRMCAFSPGRQPLPARVDKPVPHCCFDPLTILQIPSPCRLSQDHRP